VIAPLAGDIIVPLIPACFQSTNIFFTVNEPPLLLLRASCPKVDERCSVSVPLLLHVT
jgi:hypothetical protein